MRTSSKSTPCATSQRMASRRSLERLVLVMASRGVPYLSSDRVFTSHTTSTRRSAATMSISPSAHRQLRSRIRNPARSRYCAANCSPRLPKSYLEFKGHHLHLRPWRRRRGPATRLLSRWTPELNGRSVEGRGPYCRWPVLGCGGDPALVPRGPISGGEEDPHGAEGTPPLALVLLGVGHLEVAAREFLDVHVLEGHDPDILHESRRPVHVPDPRVLHCDLEIHFTVLGRPYVQLNLVRQVETALGLDDMGEQADDVPVLAVELQLHLGLVLLEILCAHARPSDQPASGASARMRSTIGQFSPHQLPGHGMRGNTADLVISHEDISGRTGPGRGQPLDVREGDPVLGGGPMMRQRPHVAPRGVPLVPVEPVDRIVPVQPRHDPVPGDLGHDRSEE